MHTMVDLGQWVPFRRVADDRRVVGRQLGEVELDRGQHLRWVVAPHRDVQLPSLDELLDQDWHAEFLVHVLEPLAELLAIADHGALLYAVARIFP